MLRFQAWLRQAKMLVVQRWPSHKTLHLSSCLLLINTGTCSVIYIAGDVAQQKMRDREESLDHNRLLRMATLGTCMGPVNHYWYVMLDRLFCGVSGTIIAKKVCLDQLIMAPICCALFYAGMCIMEGKGWGHTSYELKEKFWPTYKMDWKVWPAAQIINFYLIPPNLRVIYVCVVTFGWTVYLSHMKHKASRIDSQSQK